MYRSPVRSPISANRFQLCPIFANLKRDRRHDRLGTTDCDAIGLQNLKI
ncbi:hypothetical protein CKA32_001872 [Geitlerinema sp. FC II]|nr:hypothetical protein CKA32_001872 [Geitlerinema sp. FC II]